MDIDGAKVEQLTHDDAGAMRPKYAPDGRVGYLAQRGHALKSALYDLVILDELNCCLAEKLIDWPTVQGLLSAKHPQVELVVTGLLNKQIGGKLGISEATVKVHRGRVMEKIGVVSVAELVRLNERSDSR